MNNKELQNLQEASTMNARSSEQITDHKGQIDSSEEIEKKIKNKKKQLFLMILEFFLLILVVVLVIIFLNKRNRVNVIDTNFSSVGQMVNNGSNQINNINNQSATVVDERNIIESGESTRLPSGQTNDDPRLYLPVPTQSPVSMEEAIPAGAIKISGTESGFLPNEFRVRTGDEVTLALTSRVNAPVVLTFYDSNMAAISIGCGPLETRWVTFTAPNRPGEYVFRNDIIGSTNQTGKMIVE